MDDSNKNKLLKLENLNKFKEFIIEKIISPITTNITNLQKNLENKAEKAHNHTIADVTKLQTTLDGKAEKTHNHDSSYLKLSGGSMTGNLSFSSTNGQGVKFWRNTDEFGIYMSKADDETYGGRLWESTSDYNMYFKMGTKSHGFVFKNGNTILGGMDGSGAFRANTKISTTDIYFGGENVNNQGRFENGELTFANAKGIYGKTSNGAKQRIAVIFDACCLGDTNIPTWIRSSVTPQYLDAKGNKYNIYHSGNFNPSNYLPKSGGTMTGSLALTQDKGIVSANSEGGTLLVETNSSVNVGKTTKAVNLNCSVGSVNGSMILTAANHMFYAKNIFNILFERNNGTINKNINTCFNSTYGEFTAPSAGQYLVMCSGYELTNSNMYIACVVGTERSNRNTLYTVGSSGFTLITLPEKETLRLYECPPGNINTACISSMSYVNMLIAKIL